MIRYDNRPLRYDPHLVCYDNQGICYDTRAIRYDKGAISSKESRRNADSRVMQFNADGTVLPKRPPKTNAERQREFRRRNPDYYRLLQAKRRAPVKAFRAALRAKKSEAARVAEILHAYRTMPLMLPAPVEAIEIPGITCLPLRDAVRVPELVEIRRRHAA